jgi:hypothetical protein
MKKGYKGKNQAEAIVQILILMIGIVAISWMIGSEVKVVSAEDSTATCSSYGGVCRLGCTLPNEIWQGGTFSDCITPLNRCCVPKTIPQSDTGALDKTIDTVSKINVASQFAKSTKDIAKKITNALAPAPKVTTAETNALKDAGYLTGNLAWMVGGKQGIGAAGPLSLGGYVSIVAWSAIAFAVGRYVLGTLFGLNIQQSQALGWAMAGGTAAGMIAAEIIGASNSGGPIGLAIGLAVAAIIFLTLAKKTSADIFQFTCFQWEAQSGKGLTPTQMKERCEKCNQQEGLGCTEYQCRSLGAGCMLINDASSGKQLCIWNNTKDITPPIITPWQDALLDDFKYTPDNAISPPDKGVKVAYTGTTAVTSDGTTKCAPPFTAVSFGVQLDEPAKCKISPLKVANYSVMADFFMGRGIRDYNQSFTVSLPSKEALEAENITVDNGGKYEFYVRCEDNNGNSNLANFVFKFCISEGPDTTPPLIVGTSILDNSPISFGQSSVKLDLYLRDQTFTKENASCRWSHLDKSYNAMENNMNCTHTLLNMNAQMLYTCSTNLTGLKDSQDNKFYFRCIDDIGNANTQSYPLTLIGTKPLVIDEVGPKGVIQDSTEVIKVELTAKTSAGYDEGKAICSFSETGVSGSYVDFFYGNEIEPFSQYEHIQELWLGEENYSYYIRCRDKGGNMDDANVTFSVKIDKQSPTVVRIYKEEEYLKLITDEPGNCVYSTYGCSYLFDEGTEMQPWEDKEFYADWNTEIEFYIKCEDEYGNQPLPNECSIIARPFEIFPTQ